MTTKPAMAITDGRIADFYAARDASLVHVVIPGGVEEVGQGAFSGLPRLVSAELPSSVRIVGSCAFQGCPLLEEVRLSGDLLEMRGAFADTPRLRRILLPSDSPLRMEGALLLRGDTLLRVFASLLDGPVLRLPSTLHHVAGGALAGCSELEWVDLPDGLESIGGGAFAGCKGLRALRLPGTMRRIGGSAFAGAVRLEELRIPDSVEEVGEWCCDGCISLRTVELPARLRCPANAFPPTCKWHRRGRTHLSAPELVPGIREIPPYAFAESPALEKIFLPETVVRIGVGAFQRCPNLHAIRLPSGLKVVERNAFSALPKLEEIELPDGIAEIRQSCFWNCTSLRRVRLPASLKTINRFAFRDCTALEEIELPGGLETLVSGAFQGCRNLRRVEFPKSLETVGSGDYLTPGGEFPGTFEGCESLEEVRLPEGIRLLNDRSFSGCSQLRRVQLPLGTVQMGKDVFSGCHGDLLVESVSASPRELPGWAETVLRHEAGPLGFLFALVGEAEPFVRSFGVSGNIVPGRIFRLGRHRVLVCGPGRANAAAGTVRLAREGCRTVVDIGLCGACSVAAAKGHVFAPLICWDGDAYSQNPGENLLDPAHVNDGVISGDAPPVYTVSGLATNSQVPGPVLVDNEAYAVAAVTGAFGIRRLFVKVVSDRADANASVEFRQSLQFFGDRIDAVGTLLAARLGCQTAGGKGETP